MGNPLNRVGQRMGEVVHWVDAPKITRLLVALMANAVQSWIAKVDVRSGHIDLGPQYVRAIAELS